MAEREFVVIGGGLLGLAAARALAGRGRDVVLLEQAATGHAGGGSHGSARIFRLGYPDPEYVSMARQARGAWRDLEAEAGRQLLVPAGQLTFGDGLGGLHDAMLQAGAPCELLPAAEVAARFPSIAVGGPCLHEPESCVIAADQVLAALAGAVPDVRAGVRVTAVEPEGDRVIVRAGRTAFRARAAVVCAGPWTGALLAGTGLAVPATATLEQVAYVAPLAGAGRASDMPIFIRHGTRAPYGLPVPGSGLYKVGLHPSGPAGGPGRAGPVVSPAHLLPAEPGGQALEGPAAGGSGPGGPVARGPVAGRGEDPGLREDLAGVVRRYLPGFEPRPVRAERCVYDNTPDEDFVIDRAGPVVIGCGTSGHGFKFGPLLGEWLADLALGGDGAAVPARFALTRFARLR